MLNPKILITFVVLLVCTVVLWNLAHRILWTPFLVVAGATVVAGIMLVRSRGGRWVVPPGTRGAPDYRDPSDDE